jgi:ribosomal protein S8E
MGTQITITTDDAALAADLISLINGGTATVTAEPTPAPAPAKKTAAKKAAAPKPEPVVEPEPEDEDVLGTDDEPTEYTMADAVARATEIVQAGGADTVKAALADIGVAKVSHLKADQINEFMASVEGA